MVVGLCGHKHKQERRVWGQRPKMKHDGLVSGLWCHIAVVDVGHEG